MELLEDEISLLRREVLDYNIGSTRRSTMLWRAKWKDAL